MNLEASQVTMNDPTINENFFKISQNQPLEQFDNNFGMDEYT